MDEKEIVKNALVALRESVGDAKEGLAELSRGRGFFAILKTAARVVPPLVSSVESQVKLLGPEFSGAKKRELVLEAIMSVMPALPWWAPEWLVRRSLGKAIDLCVAELNKRLGKSW